jgi:tetratricopeptide (TPR) repeat protein
MPQRAKVEIAWLGGELADRPDDPALLARRCFMRGLAKTDLDAALDDCNRAIALKPMAAYRDQRALIFYLKGDYRAALSGYDEALAAGPILASSLLMRGMTKGKLGDAAGEDKDVAAAQTLDANIVTRYRNFGVLPR